MTTSSTKRQIRNAPRLRRGGGFILALAAALLAASCASKRDVQTTGSIPDDYRTRHPITLAEVRHELDVPLGAGEVGLTSAARDLIRGFAQDYSNASKSTMSVAIPIGAANSAAAHRASGAIRQALAEYGVKPQRIVMSSYASSSPDASAPVRLSFVAVKAVTHGCGQWPTDLFGPSLRDNENWENFGCASQQNLAAQISNPTDLVGPRGMSPIDAERRATVISTYRDGD
ncbi:pilus assembly protein CpaD [Rhizobium sp. SG_E_25_P2]|uniref:CpaD family pilus assembly protein n=1 Tax=Rhizobium sp. SG_E_25_P2 TaxID=2879942 RepID=UPI002476058A|nr:CpaD family pilus assembly lipoprotein [Rhizobium sp. SG_E_25_P2]MDH6265328.1 pilus assembly protein CpaD [Rhizobium sp. SG_E_25_P2]